MIASFKIIHCQYSILKNPPEIISVVVVDFNLAVGVSSLIQVPFHLCDAGGQAVTVGEAVGRQRVVVVILEFLEIDHI